MDSLINTLSMIFVIFLAGYVGIIDFVYFIRMRNEFFRWIKLCYSITGFYWVILYSFFILNLNIYYLPSSRTLTRIGILMVMISLSYGATVRAENARIFESFYEYSKKLISKISLLLKEIFSKGGEA